MADDQQMFNEISALLQSNTAVSEAKSKSDINEFTRRKLDEVAKVNQTSTDQRQKAQLSLLKTMIYACLRSQTAQATFTMFIGELVSITNAEDVDLGLWARKELLGYLLDKVPQRMSVYNSIVIRTRQALADILSSESLWEEAANTLQDIRPDQWPSSADASEKFDVYIKTMDLFLHANNLSQAAFTLNRATSLVHSIKDNELRLKYRYLQASILDQSQKYIEAVNGYRNVLAHSKPGNTEEQRMLLNKAIRCAVLASAGPQKVRTVANMYRVTEAASCDCFPLLEMMFLQRIIKPSVAEQFSQFLEAHQLQTAADGHSTLFEYAIREHNVSVLSSLYTNIKLENLGHMLGTNSEGAEIVCARMISESRLKGHIDQIAGLITFEGAREVKEVSAAILLKKQASMQPPLMHLREQVSAKWDERIVSLCTTVEDAVDLLIQRQPGYARMMFRNDMK